MDILTIIGVFVFGFALGITVTSLASEVNNDNFDNTDNFYN